MSLLKIALAFVILFSALAGFQKHPGSHPWIGEHVGKFLHVAGNMWAYSGDEQIKAKMDRMGFDRITA